MVRAEGLEPPRLTPLEPKSSVSTNSTTPALSELFKVLDVRAGVIKPYKVLWGCLTPIQIESNVNPIYFLGVPLSDSLEREWSKWRPYPKRIGP